MPFLGFLPAAVQPVVRVVQMLGAIKFIGFLSTIFGIPDQMTETEALRRLEALRTKTRAKQEDNTRIVKGSDAIRALETALGNGKILLFVAKALWQTLTIKAADVPLSANQIIVDAFIIELRKKYLRQDKKVRYISRYQFQSRKIIPNSTKEVNEPGTQSALNQARRIRKVLQAEIAKLKAQ